MEVDVILQWNHDGEIKPMRIRVEGNEYTIRGYRVVEHSTRQIGGLYVTGSDQVWECKIVDAGLLKNVWLVFNGRKWSVTR